MTTRQEREAYELAALRDRGVCVRCRRGEAPQLDHRQNRIPGNTVVSNLQTLCLQDHKWKSEHPRDALNEGWAVLRHTTMLPGEWPARRWVRSLYGTYRLTWVLYLDAPTEDGEWWLVIDDREAAFRRAKAGIGQEVT